jgi:hypothetical protein
VVAFNLKLHGEPTSSARQIWHRQA